jgi:hypothetical protein
MKEFVFELNQHIYDLNILRKLFRYHFEMKTVGGKDDVQVDAIFGNCDELYECSLHLFDLLDDLMSCFEDNFSQTNALLTDPMQGPSGFHVGHIFWEFAEGLNKFLIV